MGKQWKQWEIIWGGTKITADSDCIHEIKKRLLLGRKAMTNLDSMLKSRDVTLSTKVHLAKAVVFPVVMYGCENWTVKKAEWRRIDAFELVCWWRLLRVPWTARRSNQWILKKSVLKRKTDPEAETPILWPTDGRIDSFVKTLMLGKIGGKRGRGQQRHEKVGCHHPLYGHEFE